MTQIGAWFVGRNGRRSLGDEPPYLGKTLIVGGVVLVMSILAGGGWIILDRRSTAYAAGEREAVSLAVALEEQTGRTLQAAFLDLADVVETSEAQHVTSQDELAAAMGTKAVHDTLRAGISGLSQVGIITIVGADGHLINSSQQWPVSNLKLPDQASIRAIEDNRSLDYAISPPVLSRLNGSWTIFVSRAIRAPDGTTIGIVGGAIDLAYFQDFYRSVAEGNGIEVSLWRNDGTLLASYPDQAGEFDTTLYDPSASSSKVAATAEAFAANRRARDHRPTAARAVKDLPLFVSVSRTSASIEQEWRGQAIAVGIGALLSASLLALALVALLRQIARREASEITLRQHRDNLEREVFARTQALAASEARHRDVADGAADWFWETDTEGRFTFVSPRFGQAAGIPPEYFIGKMISEVADIRIAPHDYAKVRMAFTTRQPFGNIIHRVDLADGRMRFWRIGGKPFFEPGTGAFSGHRGSGTDVTDAIENELKLNAALSRAEAAEEQARRDRAKLLDAVDVVPAGFALWDAEDRLDLCNARFREMSHEASDLLVPGVRYEDFVRALALRGGPDIAGEGPDSWVARRVARHRAPSESFVQRRADGTWTQIGERRTADGGIVATYSDVTELIMARSRAEAAEEQARRARVRLVEAIEALPAGISLWDANDRLEFFNENVRKFFPEMAEFLVPGIGYEEMMRLSAKRGQADLRGKELQEWLADRVAMHRSAQGEIRMVHLPGGRSLQVEQRRMADGGIIAIRTDVTQLSLAIKRAETAETQARRDREWLIKAIDILPAGFVMWDADDRLALCNARYRELYDGPADLLQPGVRFEDLVRAAAHVAKDLRDSDSTDAWIAERLDMHRQVRSATPNGMIFNLQHADGRWIQVDERPTSDGGLVGTRIDITDILKREAGERDREKLAALGHLAGGVAHEINNLLQPMLMFPDLVAERLSPDDTESRDDLATITDCARKARDIVKNILRFARKEELALAPLDLVTELKTALAFVRDVVPATLTIRETIDDALAQCTVLANKTQLIQIVTNLIVNAAYAMNDHGTITVGVVEQRPRPAEATALGIAPERSYLAVSVTDTGCGMDEATQAKIFEPFFTTKPVGDGTGLGLSVVYGILRSWGGAITVASKPGHGATFTLYVPTSGTEAQSAAA